MSDMTQTIQQRRAAPSDKEHLQSVVDELRQLMEQTPIPIASQEDAETVKKRTEAMVTEVSGAKPDAEILEVTGSKLKKAAENLEAVMPGVLRIAGAIVGLVIKIATGR